MFLKTRNINSKNLFELEGLSLTITVDSICISLVRETINVMLLMTVGSMAGLSGGGCHFEHGKGDKIEINIMEAGLIVKVVGDGIVALDMDTMDYRSAMMNVVTEKVNIFVVVSFKVAINRRCKDTIDVIKDLVKGMDNGIGLYITIALCKSEGIEVVEGPAFIIWKKEDVDLVKINKYVGLL